MQEKAVGHARTQNFVVYVKCFILVYPGNSAGQGAKGEGPSLLGVHWALFVQRKVVLTKECGQPVLWVLMDSRCDVLQSAAPSVKWGFWNSLPSSAALNMV